MMLELKFIASIAERDIDLLVLEELSVSNEFREWFSSRVFGEPIYQAELGAWHSVSDAQFGESDLIFLFEAIDGSRIAILIENKIDAPPQPEQSARYRLRGEKAIKEGYWENFQTCVIAPNKYLTLSTDSENYDVMISYEELLAYFQSRRFRDERFAYRARIILEGIEQNRRGYQPKYNEEMTKFIFDYFAFASKEYPQLKMQEAKPRPAGSNWAIFNPESLPMGTRLIHQFTAGFVKAMFSGQADSIDSLREKFALSLPDDASIDVAGKSVAISIEVPKMEPLTISFSEQVEIVIEALQKIEILENLVSQNRDI